MEGTAPSVPTYPELTSGGEVGNDGAFPSLTRGKSDTTKLKAL